MGGLGNDIITWKFSPAIDKSFITQDMTTTTTTATTTTTTVTIPLQSGAH